MYIMIRWSYLAVYGLLGSSEWNGLLLMIFFYLFRLNWGVILTICSFGDCLIIPLSFSLSEILETELVVLKWEDMFDKISWILNFFITLNIWVKRLSYQVLLHIPLSSQIINFDIPESRLVFSRKLMVVTCVFRWIIGRNS